MVIESLQLRNYRRFRFLELEFPENLIGIIGPNGAGKSTIVEALGWALYGNRIVRTDKSDVRSQFASVRDVCAAELVFSCAGHQYRVVRQLKGKNAIAEAAIYRDGVETPAAVQDSGVTEFVEKLLGLDYQSFFASVFARQKELDTFSRLATAERLKCINRLINIEQIDRIREQVRQDRKRCRDYSDGLRASLKDERLLREQLAQLEARIADKKVQEGQAKAALEKARQALRKAKTQLEALSVTRDRFVQLSSRQEHLTGAIRQWQESLASARRQLEELEQAKVRLEQMAPQLKELSGVRAEKERLDKAATAFASRQAKEAELARLRQQMESLSSSIAELESTAATLGQLTAQLEEVSASIGVLERQLEKAEEHIRQLASDRKTVENRGIDLRHKREQVEQLGPTGPCPVCTRPLGEQHAAVLRNFTQQLEQLRQDYRRYQEQERLAIQERTRSKEELARLRRLQEELLPKRQSAFEASKQLAQAQRLLTEHQQRCRVLEQEIAALGPIAYDEKTHQTLKRRLDELTDLHNQALTLQGTVNQRPRVEAEVTRLQRSIETATAELAELREEINSVGFDEQAYQQAREEVERCTQMVEKHQDEHYQVREELLSLTKEKERVLAELDEHQRQLQAIAEAEDEARYLDLLDYHFDRFRQELANRLRPLIAARASELLRLTTQGRYSLLELDHEYNVRLYDGTTPYPLARFSGGEQDLTNLCLRIAISQVVAERSGVTPMNFIVLDEIFGSQDEHRRELILNALNTLSARFRQIFVITHIEQVRDSLPVVISVAEQGEHESVARFV
ncbi:MAG: SMC family ATPase [candidate division KSB1 bacterium]|nr:SMC family ATPase [candidate division KSB1 bacterium]